MGRLIGQCLDGLIVVMSQTLMLRTPVHFLETGIYDTMQLSPKLIVVRARASQTVVHTTSPITTNTVAQTPFLSHKWPGILTAAARLALATAEARSYRQPVNF